MFTLDQAKEAVKNKPEFSVKDKGSYTVIDYNLNTKETFVGQNESETNILLNLRGTAFDNETGKMIRLGYQKFFNYGEFPSSDETLDFDQEHLITQKLDGCVSGDSLLKVKNKITSEILMLSISEVTKNIDQFLVFSYNEILKEYEFCNIKNKLVIKNSVKKWIMLNFDTLTIKCTEDHKFLTVDGWKMAKDLTELDEFI